MKISVIIVSYNVKYFLEQAIISVRNAITPDIPTEIIVVDNNSSDGSVKMLKDRFPWIKLISNKHNPGFSIANNQGLKIAKGEYILFLNPDTIISEDTLKVCVNRMRNDQEIGAIGVRMVDGSGQFLPESKRGLPTPRVALFKMLGLHKLFPRSSFFNAYYAGHVDEYQSAEVDVLCGAFMFVRHSILKDIGGFDEAFFMYGEDIDLSYRIQNAGFKIIYEPSTNIIHYKGESTKKNSINYVKHFYQAMLIFANKHFKKRHSFLISIILSLGVYLGGSLSIIKNMFRSLAWPILDISVMIFSILSFKYLWAILYYKDPEYYSSTYFYELNLPVYILIWLITLFMAGAYDHPFKLSVLVKGMVWGLLLNGLIYGLLVDPFRPSRAIMLASFFISTALIYLFRGLYFLKKYSKWPLNYERLKRIALVGSKPMYEWLSNNMAQLGSDVQIVGFIGTINDDDQAYLGQIEDIESICQARLIDEIIFTMETVSPSRMMYLMSKLGSNITYKMVASSESKIIGSSDKNKSGEWYTLDVKYNLATKSNLRWKYLQDYLFCVLALLLCPFWLFVSSRRNLIMKGVFKVLLGRYTWLGYLSADDNDSLPKIKKSIFPVRTIDQKSFSDRQRFMVNQDYAVNYYPALDYELFLTALFV